MNQAFVKRFFPGQDVWGQRLQLMGDSQPTREIIGVVRNIIATALSDPQQPEMYVAYAQYAPPTMNLVVRATANPAPLGTALYGTGSDQSIRTRLFPPCEVIGRYCRIFRYFTTTLL